MRPVCRGDVPTDKENKSIQFEEYGAARPYLVERIGLYCSYCEMRLPMGLAIEHIQPQKLNPALIHEWHNFLLSCPSCNSRKGKKSVNADDYFWPHCDNTFRAFVYKNSRAPQISSDLNELQQKTALNTLALTGLNCEPTSRQRVKDPRWMPRLEAWTLAEWAKQDLDRNPGEEMRSHIEYTATAIGFWSIWMTVFQDDPDMRQRFIRAFAGTSMDCFDQQTQPVARPGGKL